MESICLAPNHPHDHSMKLHPHYLALSLSGSLLSSVLAANSPDLLPPAPLWRGASARLIAGPDDPWITPSEKTGLTDTPSYDETIAYLKKLAVASPLLSLQEFGRTAQGRPIHVVIASKDRAFTPDALRATGRPALLAQAGIHAGEIDGKDAGLMLLRDIAFAGKAGLLAGNHFATVLEGIDRLPELGRKVLWEGAQPLRATET